MGMHSLSIRRGGRGRKAALALVGTATVGLVTVAGMGVAAAAPSPVDLLGLLQGSDTTEVNEDLAPFTENPTANGSAEVNEEFGAPDGGGTGSLQLTTPESADKVQVFTDGDRTPLGEFVDVAAYSAFRSTDSTANEVQFPSLQLVIDFNGGAEGGFSTLFYEPVNNRDVASLTAGQWNRYEAGSQGWCSTRVIPGFEANQTSCSNGGVMLLSDIAEDNPEAVVTSFGFNQGSGNPGLISAVDLLTAPDTTYDFEPKGEEPPVVVPDPTDPDRDDDGKDDDDKKHDDKKHDDKKHDDKKHDDKKHDDKKKHHADEDDSYDGK